MLEPLTFRPIPHARVWGGSALSTFGVSVPRSTRIGEAWLLADLPESIASGRSVVDEGAHAGATLHDLLRAHGAEILGAARPASDGGFPLLVKLLDARANLSVQVHPTPHYAAMHPGAAPKCEAWVVLAAEPEAKLYIGLREEARALDAESFRKAALDGSIVKHLVEVPARVGACHYLPSGVCHALGAGVLVAEVQTPSDTTFRVYDWGRTGRELHLDEAIECVFERASNASALTTPTPRAAPTIDAGDLRTTRLCATPHFSIERIDAVCDTALPLLTDGSAVVWLVLKGHVAMKVSESSSGDAKRDLRLGRLALLPAALRGWIAEIARDTRLLRIEIPPGAPLPDGGMT